MDNQKFELSEEVINKDDSKCKVCGSDALLDDKCMACGANVGEKLPDDPNYPKLKIGLYHGKRVPSDPTCEAFHQIVWEKNKVLTLSGIGKTRGEAVLDLIESILANYGIE